ncbi:MAG: riboflavin synthase [Bryobacteraceae bacterium]|nr:riboflavin synthase [Bryobacteraceae bacterium]
MFTGIVEEVGTVLSVEGNASGGARIRIQCAEVVADAKQGSSIAINGVCLTAIEVTAGSFGADLAPETLRRTNLSELSAGSLVNLERPLLVGGRLDGHVVQGHVDGTGELLSLDLLGDENWWLRVRIPVELDRYVVFKGSVAFDGISLTVAALEDGVASVTIIPHTYANTALRSRKPGEKINIECDVLAKYVEKMLLKV